MSRRLPGTRQGFAGPPARFRAVAFALDGTLVDSAPDLAATANATLEALGHAPLPEARVAALIGGGVERLVEGALAASTGRAAAAGALAAALALFRRSYAERLFDRSRVYPGVVEGLEALDALGIACCCITNKASAFTLPLLDAAGLGRRLAFALCADRREERKPAPDMLLAACLRLHVAPAELLYVGDSRIDIEAARAAGCPVAVVDYGYHQGYSLADERPDWIIGSLVELSALPAMPRFAKLQA
ncbi:MAG TPA: phosphoglycolate phosphatase [Casimicrobiaceae bacterium]|nr:phosphoglycolate phosphatase [Casimicrobiaceae bacterium]